ncbi:TerB N-terminal domain-containing protein [Pseudomonas sp. PDM22]|uniref:tellurite resistance TerB family protein n=1 Tax=Pseudomonas sp. PDM22 TaxID=2769287 RepID=UPI00178624F2|nr:TerB N-terminal domain-containing protein [Pseudomonas sp. PDM22]MBD9513647.1 TerB N-terminal domain-containing protein [Pseudomonas sp. PDM22]
MARKRRGKKANASGGLVLAAIFIVILASIPKTVWFLIGIALVVGGIIWLIAKLVADSKPLVNRPPPAKVDQPAPSKPAKSARPVKPAKTTKPVSSDAIPPRATKPGLTAKPSQVVPRTEIDLSGLFNLSLDEAGAASEATPLARAESPKSETKEAEATTSEASRPVVQAPPVTTRFVPPAGIEKDHSEFFTVLIEPGKPVAFRIPDRSAELEQKESRWLPAGEAIEIAGEKIPGGMLYLGSTKGQWYGTTEPSMIDTHLPVARRIVDIAERLTSYWPRYDSISPEARRAYLQWLSSGRKAPHANIGYVFIFFYGLERRALLDAKTDPVAAAEIPVIIAEAERLLAIYHDNNSFQGYVRRFLDFVTPGGVQERRYLENPPKADRSSYDMPMELRVGLGQLARDKQPLPAEWALAWVLSDYNIGLRTPATRCPAEFAKLFKTRYEEVYRAGIVLPQNKTRLKVEYRPASATLSPQTVPGTEDLPDVSAVSGPRKKLQALTDECTAQLDSYSRYLGRNPDASDALEAVLQLPISLWPETTRTELESLKERIGEGMLVMSFGELAGRLKSAGALSRDKVLAFARALESLHIGLQPDVLAGSRIPKAEDLIALFATQPEDGDLRSSPAYGAASVTLDLACAVAAADGETSPQEIMLLSRHIDSWSHLSSAHRKRLKAHLRLQLNQPPTLQSLKKRLDPLDPSAKRAIVAFLAHLAQADGEVSPAEVKLLERVYKSLQLDAQLLYSDLHIAASSQPGSTPSASPSPQAVAPSPTAGGGFVLDQDRIAALQKETEQVSKLLAQVFVEEQVVEPEEPTVEEEASGDTSLWNLDAEHSAFLRLLVSRSEWSRDELEAAAADMELMLDGALEHVNDAAFDLFDMPLTEGEEPVEINSEIREQLTV